jgi:hypothetical protein
LASFLLFRASLRAFDASRKIIEQVLATDLVSEGPNLQYRIVGVLPAPDDSVVIGKVSLDFQTENVVDIVTIELLHILLFGLGGDFLAQVERMGKHSYP